MAEQLILHEGLRLTPYKDTVGKWTVLVGYNLSDRGVGYLEQVLGRKIPTNILEMHFTREDALKVLDADIARLEAAVPVHFPEYLQLDEVRQRVCLDLAFNMGLRALGFHNTIACIRVRDWSAACRHLWKSKWASQVGDGPGKHWDRADRLTRMLLTGQDYTA
jgi:lysozyme